MQVPQSIWRWKLAFYLFLAGTGAGAYLASTLMDLFGYGEPAKVGFVIAAPTVLVSTLFLIADLGKPERFIKAFMSPQHSWISRGTLILTVFIILGLVHIGFGIWPFPVLDAQTLVVLKALTSVFAAATAIYTGILIGVVVARPFWNNGMLPLLFLISATSTGIGAIFLSGGIWFGLTGASEAKEVHGMLVTLGRVDMLLIALESLVLYFYLSIVSVRSKESVSLLLSGPMSGLFWGGFVLLGLLLPFVLDWAAVYASVGAASLAIATISGIMLLVGGLFLRALILAAGLRSPIFVRVPVVVRPGV